MQLSEACLAAFKADVLARYPEEACGLVIHGEYFACQNGMPTAEARRGAFRITGEVRTRFALTQGPAEAVLHSHPYKLKGSRSFLDDLYHPAWPSVADQTSFLADEDQAAWGIVGTDGEGITDLIWLQHEPQPYEKREFAWFTSDCYAMVRDWYAIHRGITLPNFPRQWEWWKSKDLNSPANVIEDGLATIPFAERLPVDQAEIGDMAVFAIGSKVVNHLAVITGHNEMLHQGLGRYAAVDSWQAWCPRAKYVVRFHAPHHHPVEATG